MTLREGGSSAGSESYAAGDARGGAAGADEWGGSAGVWELKVAAAFEGAGHGDFVGVFDVGAGGDAGGDAGDFDGGVGLVELGGEVDGGGFALSGGGGGEDDFFDGWGLRRGRCG